MKKILSLSICLMFVLAGCGSKSDKKAEEGIKSPAKDVAVKDLMTKTQTLAKEGKLLEAVKVIDEAIKVGGENRSILGYKYDLLMKLEKYEEALAVALRRDEVADRKSPWNCISIVEAYLKLNNAEKALEYLDIAIKERNFNNLNHLKSEAFSLLKENEEFLLLLDEVKKLIGINEDATDFMVKLVDGTDYKLSDQKGKVVLIDFWATWCPPCRKELPDLKKLYSELKDSGFKIVGISLDTDEEKHQAFIKEKEMAWDLAYSGKGWYDDTVKLYNVSSIPSTWIIDKFGKLRYFDVHGEELAEKVRELLKEPIE